MQEINQRQCSIFLLFSSEELQLSSLSMIDSERCTVMAEYLLTIVQFCAAFGFVGAVLLGLV